MGGKGAENFEDHMVFRGAGRRGDQSSPTKF